MSDWVPPKQYYEVELPKKGKPIAAGCSFLDEEGRLLIGKPQYVPDWHTAGGMVEKNESPFEGACREAREEIGLMVTVPRLLTVHYIRSHAKKIGEECVQIPDRMLYHFFGGFLTNVERAAIRLPPESEWETFRFATPDEASKLLAKESALKIPLWLDAIKNNTTHYVES